MEYNSFIFLQYIMQKSYNQQVAVNYVRMAQDFYEKALYSLSDCHNIKQVC